MPFGFSDDTILHHAIVKPQCNDSAMFLKAQLLHCFAPQDIDHAQRVIHISSMNVFLNQGHMDDSDVPLFKILEESIRFEPSLSGMDDYTRLIILPLTPTGKKPKYPLEMKVCLLSQDEHWKILQNTGKEIFGDIWYLNDGKIGKARIICWNYAGRNSRCYIFQIRRGENGLFLQKVDKPVQPL